MKLPWQRKKKDNTSTEGSLAISSDLPIDSKVLYTGDMTNTILNIYYDNNVDTSHIDENFLANFHYKCQDGGNYPYGFVDLVLFLSVPKSISSNAYVLFTSTDGFRVVTKEDTTYVYFLIGGSVATYKDMIMNVKVQNNPVLNKIKDCLYITYFSWAFNDLINTGLLKKNFIEPGVVIRWLPEDMDVEVDDTQVDNNIKSRTIHYILNNFDKTMICDNESYYIMAYNIPNLQEAYNEISKYKFHKSDLLKVFSITFTIDNNPIQLSFKDAIDRGTSKFSIENTSYYKYIYKHCVCDIVTEFLETDDIEDIFIASALNDEEAVDIDEVISEEVVEVDPIFNSEEPVFTGDMEIPKFDPSRYSSTRLEDNTKDEKTNKYDL